MISRFLLENSIFRNFNFRKKVFKHSFIPYTMNDVVDYERDFRRVKQGETLIYTTLHGLKPDLSMPSDVPSVLDEKAKIEMELSEKASKEQLQNESSSENSSDDDEDEEDDDDDDTEEGDSGEEEEQLEDGTIRKKTKNMEIHNRPRDESPNSKRVYIF